MQRINFQDTEVVKAPYVNVNGQEIPVQAQFEGGTDLNAETFNQLQDNIEEAIGEADVKVWKDGPEGITYGFYLWEDDKKVGIVELFPTTVQSDNYFKPNMYVKFTNNGRTKYAKVIVAYLHHVWLYFGIEGGNILEDEPITDFKYSNEVIIDEAPRDLNTLYTNYAYDMVGFYNSQPVENPIQKYSTNEMVIGEWTNGKPLYRKIFEITDNVQNGTTIGHGISNVDLIFVERAFIFNTGTGASGGMSYPMPIDLYGSGTTSNTDRLSLYADKTNIVFKADSNYGGAWTKYVFLNYTKSTDQTRGLQLNLSDLWNIPINGQETNNGDER